MVARSIDLRYFASFVSFLCAFAFAHPASSDFDVDRRATNESWPISDSLNESLAEQIPKPPDFVSCNGFYGVELQEVGCVEAMKQMWGENEGYVYIADDSKPHYGPHFNVPLVFKDNPGMCKVEIIQFHSIKAFRVPDLPNYD